MALGLVYNIQRFSIYDGPGIRTTVFLKGCNMHCRWCHNPESLSQKPIVEYNSELCIGCGRCTKVCAQQAHRVEAGGRRLDQARCEGCGACASECFTGALRLVGIPMDAHQVMREIETDLPYYLQSGGGVTFSGGESMLQIDFLEVLCRCCAQRGIAVAVDTAGHVPFKSFERILSFRPLFLYDVKAISPDLHRSLTGVDNTLILDNLDRLLSAGARIWVRVPCVPDANDGELAHIAQHLAGKNVERVELLAYHPLGNGKEKRLGLEGRWRFRVPEEGEMERWIRRFKEQGLPARLG